METKLTDLFSRLGEDDYVINIHSSQFANKFFQRYWIITLVLLIIIVVFTANSVRIAGGMKNVLNTLEPWLKDPQYCNGNNLEVAACFIIFEVSFILPFLIVLTLIANILAKLCRDVPKSLYDLVIAGRLQPKELTQTHLTANASKKKSPKRERRVVLFGNGLREKFSLKPQNWQTYVDDFEKALVSPWHNILFIFLLIVGYSLGISILLDLGTYYNGLVQLYIAAYGFVIIFPFIAAYSFTAWLWLLWVVGNYLHRLPKIFKLDVQPKHGDNCGGFKRIGDLCFELALTISLLTILLGIWWFTGIISYFAELIPTLSILYILLTVFLLVLTFFAFFKPIWEFHIEMVKSRDKYQDETIAQMAPVEYQIRDLLLKGEYENEKTVVLTKNLEVLRNIYSPNLKYPTWPFSTSVLLGFFTTQIMPVFAAITAIFDFVHLF